MNKTSLEKFITKYSLGGTAESVILDSDSKTLTTKFISDDKSVIGTVVAKKVALEKGSYPIYNTTAFRSFLGVLDEEFKIKVNKKNDRAYCLILNDGRTNIQFMLSDESTIPKVPPLKGNIPFVVSFDIDEKFMTTFVRAKSAMGDMAETFTVFAKVGESVTVILGNASEKVETNQIVLHTTTPSDAAPSDISMSFKASYLKDIFLANKEITAGKISVSERGLAKIDFDNEDFSASYGLVEVETGE